MGTKRWALIVALTLVSGSAAADDAKVHEVTAGTMHFRVDAWGLLEATNSFDVFCLVEGPATTIVSILPEGTSVKRGDLVAELDSSTFKDQLINQEIATKSAEAAYENAKLSREVAEIALVEYKQGIYLQERQTLAGETARRESDLPKEEARRDRIQSALKKLRDLLAVRGEVRTAGEIVAEIDLEDRLKSAVKDVGEAQVALEQARIRREVFEKYLAPKRNKELASAIELARSNELAREQSWSLAKMKEARLRKQIANCKLYAPGDGLVVYANVTDRFALNLQPQIEQGSSVRERQKVFSIPDARGPLRVNVKVPETAVEWVRPGLRARVKIEGVEGDALPGSVERIMPLPDATLLFDKAKTYSTYVSIERSSPGLAIGMTAEVEIVTEPLNGVLTVPLTSVVYYDGADHVAVKKVGGSWEWRGVALGMSDGSHAEVKGGVKAGEAVAVDPAPLLSGGQKLRISLSPPRPAPKPRPVAGRRMGGVSSTTIRQKLQAIPAEARAKLFGGSPEERAAILKMAGFTDEEIQTLTERLPPAGTPR
jgi:multidrug resistance efflux pump